MARTAKKTKKRSPAKKRNSLLTIRKMKECETNRLTGKEKCRELNPKRRKKVSNKTVIKAKRIDHLDISKVHNGQRATRRKIRNSYVDLVIYGQAHKTPQGWRIGKKTFKQGRGIVPASKRGFYLDLATGTVYAKRTRNPISIRAKTYQGQPGFLVSGKDRIGRPISIHVETKSKAEAIKTAINRGDEKSIGLILRRANASRRNPPFQKKKLLGLSISDLKREAARARKAYNQAESQARQITQKYNQAMADPNVSAAEFKKIRDASEAIHKEKSSIDEYLFRIDERIRKARSKSNPPASRKVRKIYEKFSGRKSRKDSTVLAPSGTPANVAKLGRLRVIRTVDGSTWKFEGTKAPFLAADSRGKLHVVGGQYRANPAGKVCGKIDRIEYEASKPHLGQKTPTIYFHTMGEETGEKPVMAIDREGLIKIRGGAYRVESDGIHN